MDLKGSIVIVKILESVNNSIAEAVVVGKMHTVTLHKLLERVTSLFCEKYVLIAMAYRAALAHFILIFVVNYANYVRVLQSEPLLQSCSMTELFLF